MNQGSNKLFSISHMSPTNNALWDATFDSNAIAEQAKAWAASRSNFGLNCDKKMDLKKMRQFMLKSLANKRARLRKQMYLANLEIKVKETQVQIDHDLRPKIESKLDQKGSLLLERETIIHEINILEKELLLKAALTKELLAQLNVWNELYTMNSNNQVPPISYDTFPNYCSNPFDQAALTEELLSGLNVSNEQHTMQQEQQAQILDSNGYNVEQISYDPFPNYFSIPYDQALTEELLSGLNVSNEQHTMQQEQQAQILDSNGYNVEQISYDPFPNYFSIPYDQDIEPNESQRWGATIANEHETNMVDLSNGIGLMEMIPTPTFNNQFP